MVYAEEEQPQPKVMKTSSVTKESQVTTENLEKMVVPNLVGLTAREAMAVLNNKKISFQFSGSGVVSNQIPKAGSLLQGKTKIYFECQSPK